MTELSTSWAGHGPTGEGSAVSRRLPMTTGSPASSHKCSAAPAPEVSEAPEAEDDRDAHARHGDASASETCMDGEGCLWSNP